MSFDLKIKNGDLVITNASLVTVQDTDKLIQDVLKIMITEVGTNVFFTWYGSYVGSSMIGQTDFGFSRSLAVQQASNAITTLQNLQFQQQSSSQKVSASELIAALKGVYIDRNPIDPTEFDVFISVLSKDLRISNVQFTIDNSL
jgi:hypothetical protein